MSRFRWVLLVIIGFGFCYASSLTFVYVDGDDASSIAYHLLGRDDRIYPQLAKIQIAVDFVLSLLPRDEALLRGAAMSATAIAAVLFVILLLQLAFDFHGIANASRRTVIALFSLLAVPEFLYLGLLYTPMLVGMCCILAAHLTVRFSVQRNAVAGRRNRGALPWLLLSALLMGLGGLARWDLSFYGIVVVADLLFNPSRGGRTPGRLRKEDMTVAGIWTVGALAIWIIGVLSNGNIAGSFEYLWGAVKETAKEGRIPFFQLVAAQQTLFSPAFLLSCITGMLVLFSRNRKLAVFCLAMITPILVWPFWSTPKELLVFVPVMFVCAVAGMDYLLEVQQPLTAASVAKISLVTMIVVSPWLIGVRATYQDSGWGPGFELRPYNHAHTEGLWFEICFNDAVAYPSNEGPRSVGAHAATLFQGGWRRFVQSLSDERKRTIELCLERRYPFLLVASSTGFVACELSAVGFRVAELPTDAAANFPYFTRRFRNAEGRSVLVVKIGPSLNLADSTLLGNLISRIGATQAVVYGSASGLRSAYLESPDSYKCIGRTSAIVDLAHLRANCPR